MNSEVGRTEGEKVRRRKVRRWECGMGNERAESMGRKKLGRSNLIQLN